MLIKLIVGLPGSGKTHYLNKLDGNWIKIDDPQEVNDIYEILPEKADKLAIADPWFCMEMTLKSACGILKVRYPDADIELVYFKNEPEKCIENVKRRNDGRLADGFVKHFTKYYNPPENALPVYDGK